MIYSMGGGGAERTVANLANVFSSIGLEVSLILFETKFMEYELDERIKLYSCKVHHSNNKVDKALKRISLLRKIIHQERPEILMAFAIPMIPYALAANLERRCKIIGTERANPKAHGKIGQIVIRYLAGYCDGFVFQTEGAKNYYPKKVRLKSIVIPNPIREPVCQWKYSNKMKFCSAGRLHTDKDFGTLIEAFALLYNKYPDSTLTIFGEGELKGTLEKLALNLGVSAAIRFSGFTKNLQEEMSDFSTFVFSSKSEGLPNVLLEAMSIGMPCIATDCDFGPRELIQQGFNGILVPPGQKDELARAMIWMVEHKEEVQIMAENAKKVIKTHSQEVIGMRVLKYIEDI